MVPPKNKSPTSKIYSIGYSKSLRVFYVEVSPGKFIFDRDYYQLLQEFSKPVESQQYQELN